MLTIFSAPKPFKGNISVIQTNAIHSWTKLGAVEVILLGDEEGVAEVASQFGIGHIPKVERNEYGTPLISSIIKEARVVARNKLLCYVNADIILMSDFLPAIAKVKFGEFLIVGQRWDLDLNEPLKFSDDWERQVRQLLSIKGKLHSPSGLDYFVFPKGLYCDLPPFAVGRPGWDNWMVFRARRQRIPVIDATGAVTAVHQNHDYSHNMRGKTGVFNGPEARKNRELMGGEEYSLCAGHATWILDSAGLNKVPMFKHLYYELNALPVLVSWLHPLIFLRRALIRITRTIRGYLARR